MKRGTFKTYTRETLLARGVLQPNGCITIGKPTKTARYWLIRTNKRGVLAHRLMYELCNGPLQPGYLVCHACDNPRCINPAHLFAGTQTDNMQDSLAKGRRAGCKHRLSESIATEAVRSKLAGESSFSISDRLGITTAYVHRLSTGRARPNILATVRANQFASPGGSLSQPATMPAPAQKNGGHHELLTQPNAADSYCQTDSKASGVCASEALQTPATVRSELTPGQRPNGRR